MEQQQVKRVAAELVSRFASDSETAQRALWLQARHEWGGWLGRMPWDHFITLTFANSLGPEAALRRFKRWVRRVEQRAQQGVASFHVLERGAAGRWHLHVLLWGTTHVPNKGLEQAWSCGRADAAAYDKRLGASYYVTKVVGTDVAEYDIDFRHLPDNWNEDPGDSIAKEWS